MLLCTLSLPCRIVTAIDQITKHACLSAADLPRLPQHVPAVSLLCKDVDEAADDVAEQ